MNDDTSDSDENSSSRRSHLTHSPASRTNYLFRLEERLKLVQAAAGAGIWDVNLVTGENEWSDELYRLLGLDPEETEASFEVWKSTIHPEDKDISWANLENAVYKKFSSRY